MSYPLAHRLGISVTEVDDLHLAVMHLTTPERQPALHCWFTHPDPGSLSADQIVRAHLAASRALPPALEAVVLNHVKEGPPLVLEGDYLLPELAARPALVDAFARGEVRAVFLHEPDEEQLVRNLRSREPGEGEQRGRAHVSWNLSLWLREEAERYGLSALPARPWETLLDRLVDALKLA
ncbi:hypothetical protein [Deinococcus planocerae]|uniref:hypothetical protein n=1 Tax=Deinococcus planocerae TaxID=1737569 RepID=UPI001CA4B440|nr:hypothetical protein [Deinococcus planocerae]